VCCGIIYIGLLNEVMIDQRSYRKCSNHQESRTSVGNQGVDLSKNNEDTETKTIDDAAFSEYSAWSDTESDTSKEETFDHHDTDTDEGFYDKLKKSSQLTLSVPSSSKSITQPPIPPLYN